MAETYAVNDAGVKTHILKDGKWVKLSEAAASTQSDFQSAAEKEKQLRAQIGGQIEQQNVAREAVKGVYAQPETQQAVSEAGAQARSEIPGTVGKAALNLAPAALMSIPGAQAPGIMGILARMGGQGVAELIRQKLTGEGTSPESALGAAGLSSGVDVVGKTVGGITRSLAGKSPGVMAKISEGELKKTANLIKQEGLVADQSTVRQAYQQFDDIIAQQGAANVNLSNVRDTLAKHLDELALSPDLAPVLSRLTKLQKGQSLREGTVAGTQFTGFDDVAQLNKAINFGLDRKMISPNERRMLLDIKQAMYKDIDAAAVPEAQKEALKLATRTAREAFARNDLNEAINSGIKTSQVSGNLIINPSQALQQIRKVRYDDLLHKKENALFAGSFKPGELDKLETFFGKMTQKLRGSSAEGTAIILGGGGGAIGAGAAQALGAGGPAIGLASAAGAVGGVSLPSLFTKIALNDKLSPLLLRLMEGNKPIALPIIRALANISGAELRKE